MMHPDQFSEYCNARLEHDEQNGTCLLSVDCQVRDSVTGQVRTFAREIDLAPAIDQVVARFAELHQEMHGEEPAIAGWTDFVKDAVHAVSNVAHSKAVQSIYNEVKPFVQKAVEGLPYGKEGLDLANKAHDLLVKAKSDHPQIAAAATGAIKKLVGIAEDRDHREQPQAQATVAMMSNMNNIMNAKEQGLLPSTTPQARKCSYYKAGTGGNSLYHLGMTHVGAARYDIQTDVETDGLPLNVGAYQPWWAPSPAKARTTDHRSRAASPVNMPWWGIPVHQAPQSHAAWRPRVNPATVPTDTGDTSDSGYSDSPDDTSPDTDVSGWLYNKGYRSTADAMMHLDKAPGLGFTLREYYNRGMGRGKTSLDAIAAAALARAF